MLINIVCIWRNEIAAVRKLCVIMKINDGQFLFVLEIRREYRVWLQIIFRKQMVFEITLNIRKVYLGIEFIVP